MEGVNKILYNSIVIYLTIGVRVVLSFFVTRELLGVLGIQDFGILNVVAGLIAMLSFLSSTLSSTTQRFLSFSLGKGIKKGSTLIFTNSLILHFLICIVVFCLLETIGFWFLNHKLVIPNERLDAANYLYQIVIFNALLTIIISPFIGLAKSYENMVFVSILDVSSIVLKLLFIVYMSLVSFDFDTLVFYGLVLLLIEILKSIVTIFYCRYKYYEPKYCSLKKYSREKIVEMFNYSLWNSFGVLTYLFRVQGINILLNMFFGIFVNTAYGIASQVTMQMGNLTSGFTTSMNPQIVQNEGRGDRSKMLKLAVFTGKISFFVYTIFAVPVFIEMPYIFKVWLVDVPEFSVLFCRLLLLNQVIQLLTLGSVLAIDAVGKIKQFQLITGIIKLLILPIGYLLFKLGYPNYTILLVVILAEFITMVYRVYYISELTENFVINYLKEIFFRTLLPFLLYFITVLLLNKWLNLDPLIRLIIIVGFNIQYILFIYIYGLNTKEKGLILDKLYFLKNKIISLNKY